MKKNEIFYTVIPIILFLSVLMISCHSKKEQGEKKKSSTEALKVDPQNGFSATYVFPNSTFTPRKEYLPNDDILLHHEIFLKGKIPDDQSTYNVTLYTDYFEDIEIDECKFVVTSISPDSASRRTQQYKIIFRGAENDEVLSNEGGRTLKRHTCRIFQNMKFSSVGEAQFKVAIIPPGGRFSFKGIHSMSVMAEKVQEE